MAKITQVQDGDSGLIARTAINEAIKTVETDGVYLEGDGNIGTPVTPTSSTIATLQAVTALQTLTTVENLADGTTIKFDRDKTSSIEWTSATITLSDTDFVNGKVVRINHKATAEPAIVYGGLTLIESVKGSYVAETPAVANVYTFISRLNNGIKSVEIFIDDYLPETIIGTQTDWISGFWEAPTAKTYTLVLKAPKAGTITETTSICSIGSCTATFSINATPLGGTANSVSTTEQSQSHITNNAFVAGDDIFVTITADTPDLEGMALTVTFTYNLA